MNDMPAVPAAFEEEIRQFLSVPAPRREFVLQLRKSLLNQPQHRMKSSLNQRWGLRLAFAVLAVLIAVVLVIGPTKVWAAIRSLFGFIPGVGMVNTEQPVYILAEPVSQTRDRITLTVEKVIVTGDYSFLQYKEDGIRPEMRPVGESAPFCSSLPYFLTPDGKQVDMQGGQGNCWATGCRHEYSFPSLPKDVQELQLIVPCLSDTRPGAAPENWELKIPLSPAPADFVILPIIEVTQPPAASPMPESQTPAPAAATPLPTPSLPGVQFTLEQVVENEQGYLLIGSIDWPEGIQLEMPGYDMIVITASDGTRIGAEWVNFAMDFQPTISPPAPHFRWQLQTDGKNYPHPWTLTLPKVTIALDGQTSFPFDLGASPQPGQTWEVNLPLELAGQKFTIEKASYDSREDGNNWLEFTIKGDPSLSMITLNDPDNQSAQVASTGGGMEGTFMSGWAYDYQPNGVRNIEVSGIRTTKPGPWTLEWNPPQPFDPTKPIDGPRGPICINLETLPAILEQPAQPLPEGLDGKLLLQTDSLPGIHFPTLEVQNLDGSERQTIGSGYNADLSRDGRWVIYQYQDQFHLFNTETSQSTTLSWLTAEDRNPYFSPDASQIAFQRGIQSIVVADLQTQQVTKLISTLPKAHLRGWLPQGDGLFYIVWDENGERVETVPLSDTPEAKSPVLPAYRGRIGVLHPDQKQIAFTNLVYGTIINGVYTKNIDEQPVRLLTLAPPINFNAIGWSKDGQWLMVSGAHLTTAVDTENRTYLIQPETCQVIMLQDLKDAVVRWAP